MAETPSTHAEGRCANCGAVLYEGAAWCGMCFEPVGSGNDPDRPEEPDPEPVEEPLELDTEPATDRPEPEPTASLREPQGGSDPGPAGATTAEPALPGWPCAVCGTRNPIELDFCETCGASFASLMRQETLHVKVDPRAAFRRSLLFPGSGHRMIPGREVDGLARSVLFAMLLLATLMLGFSGIRSGAVLVLFLVYLAATIGVYLLAAFEAARLAQGGEPLVSSRALLWATVAILLLSILVVAFVIGTSGRR
jgi:hypothetical protein